MANEAPTSHRTRRAEIPPYQTRDGSEIRELMHPRHHPCRLQSLAEATVPPGGATLLHRHHASEELYHLLAGRGEMQLGESRFTVRAGDTICIPPGVPHNLRNTGRVPLRLLCCCTPPYQHEDTELL